MSCAMLAKSAKPSYRLLKEIRGVFLQFRLQSNEFSFYFVNAGRCLF